jgi:hypothetical protein
MAADSSRRDSRAQSCRRSYSKRCTTRGPPGRERRAALANASYISSCASSLTSSACAHVLLSVVRSSSLSVGRPKHLKVMATGASDGDLFVGSKASEMRGILRLSYPSSHGVINDWEDMHAVWSHMYRELAVVQDQHPVLLTEAPLNPKSNRGKAAEIFFETFNVPALYVQVQAILSLYVDRRMSGIQPECSYSRGAHECEARRCEW